MRDIKNFFIAGLLLAAVVLALGYAAGFIGFFPEASSVNKGMAKKVFSSGSNSVDGNQNKTDTVADSRREDILSIENLPNDQQENILVYEKTNRGVVNISTEVIGFGFSRSSTPDSTGSGVIVDKAGYVLTNYHVVKDAYKVFVNLHNDTQREGEVIGKDAQSDLALIKFSPDGQKITVINMGGSANLRVGQKVLAIGNPFGYDRTLTTGVISGIGRPVPTGGNLIINDMIQTDASINPGNSGGPLLDSKGLLIGINTVIFSPTGGSVGVGFAIPVDTVKKVFDDLRAYGKVMRGWLDITPVQLDSRIVRYFNLPVSSGLLVSEVEGGGNAEKAGLRGGDQSRPIRYGRYTFFAGGDIVVAIKGQPVPDLSRLLNVLGDSKPQEVVPVTVMRNQKEITLNIRLAERPAGLLEN